MRDSVSLYPIKDRENKVKTEDLGKIVEPHSSFSNFLDSLPAILKGSELKTLLDYLQSAIRKNKLISVGMGAHVIKTGISPLLIDQMKQKRLHHIAMNGAGPIHDFELAFQGETSEDVARGLEDGTFGMIRETGDFLHAAIEKYGYQENRGMGYAIGKAISEENLPYKSLSILANAYEMNIPVTVHTAIGTDIIYQHPKAVGAHIGQVSMNDFDTFINLLPQLHEGGVFMNFGSAVIIPEVFLKALTVARNVTQKPYDFSTANFDMMLHYRPNFNVLSRPVQKGRGFHFSGHHEIMLPLLFAALNEIMAQKIK